MINNLDFYSNPHILAAFVTICPHGLKGWESDYYYVCSCLLDKTLPKTIFNEKQYKQWLGLEEEILHLLLFFRLGSPNVLDFSCFLYKETHTMNLPYFKFTQLKQDCSNETFSRFITVSGRFILQLYFLVFRHVRLLKQPENTTLNDTTITPPMIPHYSS